MSKATIIRRKALESVRRQDWESAIKEYLRLVELDRSNPNIYNELGDLYLKTGNKMEAGTAFMQAIDAYAQVSLFNNAVAVCKKVMRILPTRVEVQAKLGFIRMRQGLTKEAESYYISYLDRLAEGATFDPVAVSKIANDIAAEMSDSETVLSKLAECLLTLKLAEDAVTVLIALHGFYDENDNEAGMEAVGARIEALDAGHLLDAAIAKKGKRTTDRARVSDDDSDGAATTPASMPVYGEIDIPPSSKDVPAPTEPAAETVEVAVATEPEATESPQPDSKPEPDVEPTAPEPVRVEDTTEAAPRMTPAPPSEPPRRRAEDKDRDKASHIHVSSIIDEFGDNTDNATEADFRSHYDLGMAYLEMALYAEAIREYQAAAKSPEFQIKSLEMIGLCFLRQDKPTLAIKQLTKGLGLVGRDDLEAIGIRYNLGLAYEMAGNIDQARGQFEEVYVVDVTFRDVAEKIQKYSSS